MQDDLPAISTWCADVPGDNGKALLGVVDLT